MTRYGSKWSTLVGVTLVLGLAACKDGKSTTDPPGNGNPSISVSVSPQTVSIAQGGTGSVSVTVSRAGGFSGEIALTVQGLPAGVTADASPSSVPAPATSATVNLAVGAAVAAGSYTVTVRASGNGVTAQTASFTLTVTAVAQGDYTLSLNPTTVSLQQGGSGAVTVSITRTNFTGTVALSVTGAPSGLVTAFAPAAVSGNSSALSLTAGQTAAPGTYTLTIKGTANGVADRTATLTVTITAAPPSGNVTWSFCAVSGVPNWVAWQDGTNAWAQATPTGNTYSFNFTSDHGGIALATTSGTDVDIEIFYGTTAEFRDMGAALCPGSGLLENYTGSVAGFAANDQALITMGGAVAIVLPSVNPNFALTDVPDGQRDIIAALITQSLQGGTLVYSLNRLIIRRGQNPAPGAVLSPFDFASAEAFAPVVRNVSLTNLGTDVALTLMGYNTANGTTSVFFTDVNPGTATSRQYPGVPAAQQAAGDLHMLTILATPPGQQTPTETRSASIMFGEAVDKAVPLGPSMGNIVVNAGATSPYVMPRLQASIQPEYNKYFVASYLQSVGGVNRSVTIASSIGYVGSGASTFDVTMPDLSAVPGWNSTWGFIVRNPITWWFSASGWDATGGATESPWVEGGSSRSATKTGELRT